jgi:hypothetical protein
MTDKLDIEAEARKHCDWLLETEFVRLHPRAIDVVILAFTIGAAWGLDKPELIEGARLIALGSRS